MKVVIFILFLIYLQDVLCDKSDLQSAKFFVQSYGKRLPKKHVQILISKRLFIPEPTSLKTKKPNPANKDYTVFPAVGSPEKILVDVPDSPYFSVDQTNEHKPRVKKVLQDYVIGVVRRKRSITPLDVKLKQQDAKKTVTVEDAKKAVTVEDAKKAVPVEDAKKAVTVDATKKSVKVEDAKSTNKTRKIKSKKPKRSGRSKNKTRTTKKSKELKKHVVNLRSKRPVQLKYTKRAKRSRSQKSKVKRSRVKRHNDKKISKKVGDTRRLISARDAVIEDYPYVVSIQKNREHWCAGALLNPRLVITTANCIWKASRVSRLRVRAGSHHTNRGGQVANIQEVMKHPQWSIRKSPDNDVALLLLDSNIKFSHSVHGVDLPNRVMLPAFEDAWVTSWGAERRDGVYDKTDVNLQVFHTRLMNRAKCNNVTQRFGVTVTDNFICLAQTGKRGPCTRDTGAPAVSDGVLWGLASWGIRKLCGTERFPAMFSYLASQSNMDFLLNATHYLMADERFYPYPDRYPTMHAQPVTRQTRPQLPYR